MAKLTHIDEEGNARMVDVGAKQVTERRAVAEGFVTLSAEALRAVLDGQLKKGDALGTARIAGIMAAKRTHEIIPLCHPLSLSGIVVELIPLEESNTIRVVATVTAVDRTGVEMEALTAVSAAALTIYDMCKALDQGIVIRQIALLEKEGGQRGEYRR